MVKEPDNPHDPNAIAVQTLSGQTAGYVPKEHTARFPHRITFGHVYSSGRASSVGLWGATVSHQPFCKYLTHTLTEVWPYSPIGSICCSTIWGLITQQGHLVLHHTKFGSPMTLVLGVPCLQHSPVCLRSSLECIITCRWLCVQPCRR